MQGIRSSIYFLFTDSRKIKFLDVTHTHTHTTSFLTHTHTHTHVFVLSFLANHILYSPPHPTKKKKEKEKPKFSKFPCFSVQYKHELSLYISRLTGTTFDCGLPLHAQHNIYLFLGDEHSQHP